jgi:hypothetical protein
MAVDQYAITTLAALKSYLGISAVTDDAVLESAIDRATYAIESYLDRYVVQRRIYEWTTANGAGALVLRHPPVGHVHYVAFGSQACMYVRSTVATDISATVTISENRMTLVRVQSDGTETVTQKQFAIHKTTNALATQISATTGFAATLAVNTTAQRMNRIVGRDLVNAPLTVTFADQAQLDTTADLHRGILYYGRNGYDPDDGGGRWPAPPISVFVDYDGGYETVPPDIVHACQLIAARIYNGRKRDTGVQSESFGDYSYTLGSGAEMDAEALRLLSPFKRIR